MLQATAAIAWESLIASDLARTNVSIHNFLRRGQQEDLNMSIYCLLLKHPAPGGLHFHPWTRLSLGLIKHQDGIIEDSCIYQPQQVGDH